MPLGDLPGAVSNASGQGGVLGDTEPERTRQDGGTPLLSSDHS